MGQYIRLSGKDRRLLASYLVNCCMFCKKSEGTLRAMKDSKGKRIKVNGKTGYYHEECLKNQSRVD